MDEIADSWPRNNIDHEAEKNPGRGCTTKTPTGTEQILNLMLSSAP